MNRDQAYQMINALLDQIQTQRPQMKQLETALNLLYQAGPAAKPDNVQEILPKDTSK